MIRKIFYVFGIFIVILFKLGFIFAQPSGATNLTVINSSNAPSDIPTSISAQAGNVTEINIFGYSTTQTWQGYFGNVSGTIQLADSADKVFYNWTDLNPKGEVFATTNSSVSWPYIQCFNYTANGTYCSEDNNQAGETSLCGMNLSQLESNYSILPDDVDGVNETFNLNNHPLFYVGFLQFNSGECKNTKIYNSSGTGSFDEVLLYEPNGRSVIFSSILKQDSNGFDSKTHDFEMMVLENGHGGDTNPTTYYFYVELL